MKTVRYVLAFLAIELIASLAWASDTVAADVASQVKAAYIYKFASYVEWPAASTAQAGAPFVIGIVDADSLGEELKKLSVRHQVKNRAVQVRKFKPGMALTGLQVLYVGQNAGSHASALIDSVAAQPVLTMTESAGMLGAGSAINLIVIDDRIRFEISIPHAEANGLKISSRLLDVAYRIEGRTP